MLDCEPVSGYKNLVYFHVHTSLRIDSPSPHSGTSDHLPIHPVGPSEEPVHQSGRIMTLAEDVEEIWELEHITLDAVLGMMSFSSRLESIEMDATLMQ